MQMPIPDDWDLESTCEFAVCWPDSPKWKAILFGLISSPRQGRFWDADTGNIKATQALFNPFYEANFNLTEVLMSCSGAQTLADSIAALIVALGNGQGGGGCATGSTMPSAVCYATATSGVQGYVPITDLGSFPMYGTQPIAVLPEGGVPVGYDDQAQFDTDRCNKASKLVDDWGHTLINIGQVAWFQSALGIAFLLACFVGLITVAPEAIPIALFLLLTIEGLTAGCLALGNAILDNKADVVCAIYNHETVEDALVAVSNLIADLIAIIDPGEGVALALKRVALLLLSVDTLNKLFTSTDKGAYTDYDCSGCAGIVLGYLGFGTIVENGLNVVEIASDTTEGFEVVYINFRIDNAVSGNFYPNDPNVLSPIGDVVSMDFEISDGAFTPAGGPGYWGGGSPLESHLGYADGDGSSAPTYNSTTLVASMADVRSVAMVSSTPFTVRMTRTAG